MCIVQIMNYHRPFLFILLISILNEQLQLLDQKIMKFASTTDDRSQTQTFIYETIEDYRKKIDKIWQLHELLNDCFGFSNLVITLNAMVCASTSLFFSILYHSKFITIEFIAQPSLHTFHIAILFVTMVYTCDTSNSLV